MRTALVLGIALSIWAAFVFVVVPRVNPHVRRRSDGRRLSGTDALLASRWGRGYMIILLVGLVVAIVLTDRHGSASHRCHRVELPSTSGSAAMSAELGLSCVNRLSWRRMSVSAPWLDDGDAPRTVDFLDWVIDGVSLREMVDADDEMTLLQDEEWMQPHRAEAIARLRGELTTPPTYLPRFHPRRNGSGASDVEERRSRGSAPHLTMPV